ncbi:N-acetyltransferase [Fusibacter paucivorans]|uniref:N-acetyltransferase n=1 Tax=Fusibacter paucivorans TaxID=76009 RepID=A0ABS5PTQ9_9FIRM|nr:N-acetyltransferase [Fusibacter paucivorans]MBS7528553.1 N-acetyltransferase [Fusibacter paucivorans]
MGNYLELKKFSNIDLSDHFFDSLKSDYPDFEDWYHRKANKKAYVLENKGIQGFLYMKFEKGSILDVNPIIKGKNILKIGTFKINPHGTRLGERFIKKAFDYAVSNGADKIYVTIFPKHVALIKILKTYGFKFYGTKTSAAGNEDVYIKNLRKITDDLVSDYPLFSTRNKDKYILSIYPKYHSKLFPDSILNNESFDILEDQSHTNSIHKVYVCKMPQASSLKPGDLIVIYRTGDDKAPAEYRSVATSICVVEDVKSNTDFHDFESYYAFSNHYSIFDKSTLKTFYEHRKSYIIKMTYNAAFSKRLTRKTLADNCGLNRAERWSLMRLTGQQFDRILERGQINESIIID